MERDGCSVRSNSHNPDDVTRSHPAPFRLWPVPFKGSVFEWRTGWRRLSLPWNPGIEISSAGETVNTARRRRQCCALPSAFWRRTKTRFFFEPSVLLLNRSDKMNVRMSSISKLQDLHMAECVSLTVTKLRGVFCLPSDVYLKGGRLYTWIWGIIL